MTQHDDTTQPTGKKKPTQPYVAPEDAAGEDISEQQPNKGSWLKGFVRLVVTLVIIVIITGAGYFAYLAFQNYTLVSTQLAEQQVMLTSLEKQLNQALPLLREEMTSSSKSNQETVIGLRNFVNETAARLTEAQGVTRYEWLLAEAEYLMRLAQQRLILESDAIGALSILQSADGVLVDAGDPNLIGVRQQLAREMELLAAFRGVDREGLYLHINVIIESVESWSPAAALVAQQPTMAIANATPTWAERLSQFIRISRVDAIEREPIQPHLVPLYRALLQNALSQAETAVLRQQPEAYRIAVQSANTFLERYGSSSGSPDNLGEKIAALGAIDLDRELPKIGSALMQLKDYIATVYQLQRSVPEEPFK